MNAFAQTNTNIKARNVIEVSENLVTAGQPTAESLAELSKLGFKAVINLAPPTVADAVSNESQIITDQGMAFVNIPVLWSKPTEEDFQSFAETMKRFQGQKVLVHCQANMRASAMTFLYRVIVNKENPAIAYETLLKVWTPKDQWKELINTQLKKAHIAFEIK
jgi:protein tyrosine phosphatase (PTP) superfamily phosphohydrolase (DUF442 family)